MAYLWDLSVSPDTGQLLTLDPNEGGLPKEVDGYGVRLRVTYNVVVASKPGGPDAEATHVRGKLISST
jgi:hypothetical protein